MVVQTGSLPPTGYIGVLKHGSGGYTAFWVFTRFEYVHRGWMFGETPPSNQNPASCGTTRTIVEPGLCGSLRKKSTGPFFGLFVLEKSVGTPRNSVCLETKMNYATLFIEERNGITDGAHRRIACGL